ncbi:MAG: hypothetical protein ABH837_01045 [bacterium]
MSEKLDGSQPEDVQSEEGRAFSSFRDQLDSETETIRIPLSKESSLETNLAIINTIFDRLYSQVIIEIRENPDPEKWMEKLNETTKGFLAELDQEFSEDTESSKRFQLENEILIRASFVYSLVLSHLRERKDQGEELSIPKEYYVISADLHNAMAYFYLEAFDEKDNFQADEFNQKLRIIQRICSRRDIKEFFGERKYEEFITGLSGLLSVVEFCRSNDIDFAIPDGEQDARDSIDLVILHGLSEEEIESTRDAIQGRRILDWPKELRSKVSLLQIKSRGLEKNSVSPTHRIEASQSTVDIPQEVMRISEKWRGYVGYFLTLNKHNISSDYQISDTTFTSRIELEDSRGETVESLSVLLGGDLLKQEVDFLERRRRAGSLRTEQTGVPTRRGRKKSFIPTNGEKIRRYG